MQEFTIYGRPGCGFCSAAISLCESNQFDFKYIDIWKQNISKEDLAKLAGKSLLTVPHVFHGEQHVGGFDDLQVYVANLK